MIDMRNNILTHAFDEKIQNISMKLPKNCCQTNDKRCTINGVRTFLANQTGNRSYILQFWQMCNREQKQKQRIIR